MLELFLLINLWEAVKEWETIRRLVGAVILVLTVLQLVAWCAEIVRLGLAR